MFVRNVMETCDNYWGLSECDNHSNHCTQSNENQVDLFCEKRVQQNGYLMWKYMHKNSISDKFQPWCLTYYKKLRALS